MINWKLSTDKVPKAGKRIALLLPDGRVCSGRVTESGGFVKEFVDNMDLILSDYEKTKWIYLKETK